MWPYLLGHYKWDFGPAEQAAADSRVQEAYEHKLSDWMAIEAIVRQRDKEINAANIAKLSGNGKSKSLSTITRSLFYKGCRILETSLFLGSEISTPY